MCGRNDLRPVGLCDHVESVVVFTRAGHILRLIVSKETTSHCPYKIWFLVFTKLIRMGLNAVGVVTRGF